MKKIEMTLGKKIIAIYVLCVFLPILCITVFFSMKIRDVFEERTRDTLQHSMEKTASNIEYTLESAEHIAISMGVDESLVELLQNKYENYEEFYQVYNSTVTGFLKEITTVTQGMNEIRVYTENPTIYNSSVYRCLTDYPEVVSWLEKSKQGQKHMQVISWVRYQNDIEASGIRQPAICVLYRIPIYNSDYKYELAIQIILDMEEIYYWMQNTELGVKCYLVNSENQVVASTNREYEAYDMERFVEAEFVAEANDEICVINLTGSLEGWTLVGVANQDSLMSELGRVTTQTSILFVLGIVFSAAMTILLIRPYTTRLKVLTNRMEQFVATDFTPIQTKPYNDEVEKGIQSFNHMIEHIRVLIDEVYVLNIEKKALELEGMRARMNALISQVNPHFLFNTLNAILVISERNQYKEVSWIIEHLSIMMRKLLDWRDDQVTVREELDFIRMYLNIEKLRFSSRMDFEIEMDKEIEEFRIPKMSIQPLVENACKHGIHKSSEHGFIRVSVTKEENSIAIRVVNTGEALAPERIQELQESVFEENTEKENRKNVGLRNVYSRVQLYYKDAAEILMESREGENCFGFIIHVGEEHNDSNYIGG